MIVLCKVSIVKAIKYQDKDANRFAVLTVFFWGGGERGLFWQYFTHDSSEYCCLALNLNTFGLALNLNTVGRTLNPNTVGQDINLVIYQLISVN